MIEESYAAPLARIDAWLRDRRLRVLAVLLLLAAILRAAVFVELQDSPVMGSYEYSQMDMEFFDKWAVRIVRSDPLGREPWHPIHRWHASVAGFYLDMHPELVQGKSVEEADPEVVRREMRRVWNRWYGGNKFHQEPLFAYLLAGIYASREEGPPDMRIVYGLQVLVGLLTLLLLFLLARRQIGDLVAVLTALLAMTWGPPLHYEVTLLRTTLITFTGILMLYCTQRMMDSRVRSGVGLFLRLFGFGCLVGVAATLKTTFLPLGLGLLLVLFWPLRGRLRETVKKSAVVGAGVLLALLPVLIRNAIVGAPLFSMTSVGPVTFAGGNVEAFRAIGGWFPFQLVAKQMADVLDESNGAFFATVMGTIATHASILDYIGTLWSKFAMVFHGYEIPNNTNYYYSCVHSSVLGGLGVLVKTSWLLPAGVVGIAIALWQRRSIGGWLWLQASCFVPMIVFYVLSRFRVPLMVSMMPFAAFGLVQCVNLVWRRRWVPGAVAIVCFGLLTLWMSRPTDPYRPRLGPGEYELASHYYYGPRIQMLLENGDTAGALRQFEDLFATAPAYLDEIVAGREIRDIYEYATVMDVFEPAYRSYLEGLERIGDFTRARAARIRADRLSRAGKVWDDAEESRKAAEERANRESKKN